MIKLIIKTSEDMVKFGQIIGSILKPNDCLALKGDLGAGKTTFTKGIGKALNIVDTINSPTFTIMKIYQGDLTLYHLDVYRVENVNDDFELEEYFYLDGITVIEWAENIKNLLPENTIFFDFSINLDESRTVCINASDTFLNKLKEVL